MPLPFKLLLTSAIVWFVCGMLGDPPDDAEYKTFNYFILNIGFVAAITTITSLIYLIWSL